VRSHHERHRQKREAYLETLANDFPNALKAVHQTVERGSGRAYDEACRALAVLSEAYSTHSSQMTFRQELNKFMAAHMRRKTLVHRLVKAGIWNEK